MSPTSSLPQLAPFWLLSALLLGCGGEPRQDAAADAPPANPAAACRSVSPGPIALAVREFITAADPAPRRFLTAAATDSALPQSAQSVVERKGPVFIWPSDAAAQAKMRTKLEGDGPWINMLVVVRDETPQPDGTVEVRVGGWYVGLDVDGRESPERRFTVECVAGDTPAWRVVNAASSQSP
jgi:hypothetical protein